MVTPCESRLARTMWGLGPNHRETSRASLSAMAKSWCCRSRTVAEQPGAGADFVAGRRAVSLAPAGLARH